MCISPNALGFVRAWGIVFFILSDLIGILCVLFSVKDTINLIWILSPQVFYSF